MNKNTMSKSQKRKQRLLRKGAQMTNQSRQVPIIDVKLPPIAQIQQTQGGRGKGSARRNKSRQARRQNSGVDSYLSALTNPEYAQGAKVPDEIGYPTGTFQLTKQGVLTTGTSPGDSVGISFSPVVGVARTNGYPIVTYNGATATSLATGFSVDWPSKAAVTSAFMAARPVSAMVEVSFIGASTADQGRLCCGTSFIQSGNTSPGNVWDTWAQLPGMSIWPSKNGCQVMWKPLDNSNFEFLAPSNSDLANYPQIFVALTGLATGTSFMYRVVCNFEAIPTADTFDLVETKSSPVNLRSLEKAFAWAQEAANNVRPLVGVVGTALQYGAQAYKMANSAGMLRQLPGAIVARTNGLKPLASLELKLKALDLKRKEEESKADVLYYDEERGYGRDPVNRSSSSNVQVEGSLRSQAPAPQEGLTRTSSSGSIGSFPLRRQ